MPENRHAAEAISPSGRDRILLALMVAAGAMLRLPWLGRDPLWIDELYTGWSSSLPLDELLPEVAASGHPPFHYLVGKVWFAFSTGSFWVRLPSVAFGLATIWLAFLLGRELYARRAGLWAAAMVTVSPIAVIYSRDATMYSLAMLLATLSFYLLVICARRGSLLTWTAYVGANTLLFFTHFYGIVAVAAAAPAFWLLNRKGMRGLRDWVLGMAAVAAGLALSLAVSLPSASSWVRFFMPGVRDMLKGVGPAPYVFTQGYAAENIARQSGAVNFTRGQLAVLALGVALIAATALFRSVRSAVMRRETAALAIFVAGMVVAPVFLQYARGDIPFARFYVWAAPCFLLLLALPFAVAPRRAAYTAGIVVLAGMLSFSLLAAGSERVAEEWGEIMKFVASRSRGGDEVLCYPLHMCLMASEFYDIDVPPLNGGFAPYPDQDGVNFYGPPGTEWRGYRDGNVNLEEGFYMVYGSDIAARLSRDLAGAERVFLVTYRIMPESSYSPLYDSWGQADELQVDENLLVVLFRDPY